MNIKEITDQIFDFGKDLHNLIMDEQDKLYVEKDEDAPFDQAKVKQEEEVQNTEIRKTVQPVLEKKLASIFPEAKFWYKDTSMPSSEYKWVVSPYVQRLMGLTYTSIALQKNDELPLGIFFNWNERKIITGEKGLGSNCFEEDLKVSNNTLSSTSSYIGYFPDRMGSIEEKENFKQFFANYKSIFDKLKEVVSETRPAYNSVMENVPGSIINVAGGKLDFTYAGHFNYTDVAAAIAVVEESGGVCTDFRGGKEKLYTGEELFCSNKAIHDEFLKIAQQHLNF